MFSNQLSVVLRNQKHYLQLLTRSNREQKRSYNLPEVTDDLVAPLRLKSRPLDTDECLFVQTRVSLIIFRSTLTFFIQ